jgi:hypothetical protein
MEELARQQEDYFPTLWEHGQFIKLGKELDEVIAAKDTQRLWEIDSLEASGVTQWLIARAWEAIYHVS